MERPPAVPARSLRWISLRLAPAEGAMTAEERRGVLAGGLWLVDTTKTIDRYPAPSRLATVSEVVRSNGGGAFNILVDLARLGAGFPLVGIGAIGRDAPGDWILDHCRRHKIDTAHLHQREEEPTSATDVMTEIGTGRRTFFYLPGANVTLEAGQFLLEQSTARLLYLGYPGLLPGLDRIDPISGRTGVELLLRRAQRLGLVTAVDLVSAETSDWITLARSLPAIDLLFVNEWEAAQLLGQTAIPEKEISAADLTGFARSLLARGVGRAVIVHCARGAVCVAAQDGATFRQGAVALPGEELRGTCGAGDALAAGFLFAFHGGQSWAACLELALCAAATCLHHLSSSEGVRPAAECLAYGCQQGFQEFL